jgi:hypothetical protein
MLLHVSLVGSWHLSILINVEKLVKDCAVFSQYPPPRTPIALAWGLINSWWRLIRLMIIV